MTRLGVPVILTALGVLVCLALFAQAAWYTFVLFMFVAQPLFLVAAVWFVGVVLQELRRKQVL